MRLNTLYFCTNWGGKTVTEKGDQIPNSEFNWQNQSLSGGISNIVHSKIPH